MRDERHIPTETYKYHNVNPKGYITGDCVERAITLATGLSYEDVVMGLAKTQCEIFRSGGELYPVYLNKLGWVKNKQPRKRNGKKYTIDEFCEQVAQPNKSYVVSCANHLTCVVNKKINDIWDCGHKCVGNYWSIEE